MSAAVDAVNRIVTGTERIRRHAVLDEPFTVANGRMTPTLKIKRHVIHEEYAGLLERLYDTSR